MALRRFLNGRGVDETHPPGDLFQTGDLHTRPVLDRADEFGGFEQGIMRPRIKPGEPAAEHLDVQGPRFEVMPVHVGDLELPAR